MSWPTTFKTIGTWSKSEQPPRCLARVHIKTNRDGMIQFLIEWQRIDREIATGTYEYLSKAINNDGSVSETGLRLIIEEIKDLAKVNREIALSEVADVSILRETQKELG